MVNSVDERLISLMKQVNAWLVAGNFTAIERCSAGIRLSAGAMAEAVSDYGRTLVMPKDEFTSSLDAVQVKNASVPTWSVHLGLWTEEEGRSDLCLECTVMLYGDDGYALEVDNIHVL